MNKVIDPTKKQSLIKRIDKFLYDEPCVDRCGHHRLGSWKKYDVVVGDHWSVAYLESSSTMKGSGQYLVPNMTEVITVLCGGLTITVGEQSKELKTGDSVVIPPDVLREIVPTIKDTRYTSSYVGPCYKDGRREKE